MKSLNLELLKTLSSEQLLETMNSLENIYPRSLLRSIFHEGIKYSKEGNSKEYCLRPFLDQEYLDRIHEKIVLKNNWSSEEINTMKDMIQYINSIEEIMKPLKLLNIEYNIGITGGAIRDFLNHQYKKIKDVDIVLNVFSTKVNISKEDIKSGSDVFKFLTEYEKIEPNLKQLNIPEFKEDIHSTAALIEQFIFHIVKHSVMKKLIIEKEFQPRGIKKPKSKIENEDSTQPLINYINDLLRGIIKIKQDKESLPIDILISNESVESYMALFDFGICQAALTNDTLKEQIKDIDNITEEEVMKVINNIYLHQNYINDVAYDKLTFLLPETSLENLENVFDKHLQRIRVKYPNHKIRVINEKYNYNTEEDKQMTYTDFINAPIESAFNKPNDNFIFLRDFINYCNISEAVEKKVPFKSTVSKRKKI